MKREGWLYVAIVVIVVLLFVAFSRFGPSIEDQYASKGREVKACIANGGDWYNTPGWGESCNFDTRKGNK